MKRDRSRGTTARPGRGAARGAVVLSLAVVAGAGAARFVTYEPSTAGLAAAPAAQDSGDLASVTRSLEAAVSQDPRDVRSLQALGSAYVSRAAQTGDPAFYGLAEAALDRAEAEAPGDPETALARAALALALHDFDRALELGQRALQERPASAEALGAVVDAQVELGRYDEAAATLQRMLDRRPALPALARASYLRQLHGDLSGAVLAMEQARAAGSPRAHDVAVVGTLLGGLHLQRADLPAARTAFEEALRLSPGFVEAELGLARVLEAGADLDGAVELLRSATERQPSPAALALLAELQEAAGDAAAAEDSRRLVRAIATLQEQAGQVVDLEMALFEADSGDPARAVELARRAHAARPDNVFAQDALAWALHRQGRTGEAVDHAQGALRLGTADPSLQFRSASVLAGAGHTGSARAALTVAARSPWFSVTHRPQAAALAAALGVEPPAAWVSP